MSYSHRRYHSYKSVTFGPGRLEDIKLWSRGVVYQMGIREYRIDGTFRVYCGNGNEHIVDVSTKYVVDDSLWLKPADEVAEMLLEGQLEDWTDPCEDGTDD